MKALQWARRGRFPPCELCRGTGRPPGGGEPPAGRACADPVINPVRKWLHDRVGPGPGQRTVQPDLGAAVAADKA